MSAHKKIWAAANAAARTGGRSVCNGSVGHFGERTFTERTSAFPCRMRGDVESCPLFNSIISRKNKISREIGGKQSRRLQTHTECYVNMSKKKKSRERSVFRGGGCRMLIFAVRKIEFVHQMVNGGHIRKLDHFIGGKVSKAA